MSTAEFDYIIVGAGSAGCVLARRLTENPAVKVLLLEAGGRDIDPLIHIPLGLGRMWETRAHDWGYDTEPEPELKNREIEMMRGKVLGGSSSINAIAHIRGNPGDYDRWAANGLPTWNHEQCLPYFKKCETWEGEKREWRGDSGPINVRYTDTNDPIVDAIIAAAQAAGYPKTDDISGPDPVGFGHAQSAIRNGRRCSAAVGYLRPALSRPGLKLEMHTHATRVLFQGSRAVGIEYLRGGSKHTAHATREVLLAGGSINTPQLLMLSGIGRADHLKQHGISVLADLPGVGGNLQDHLSVGVTCYRKGVSPLQETLRFDRIAWAMVEAYLFGTGRATQLPGGVSAPIKTDPSLPVPDIQYLFRSAAVNAKPWMPLVGPSWRDAIMLRPVLLHPESRGTLELASADPLKHPRIRANFLSRDYDKKTLIKGVRVAREILSQKPMDEFRAEETSPGPKRQSDEEILEFIRATALTAHHPMGTCKMGTDEMAVVDPELRVRGLENLRVIDASVMPDLVSANINACVLMIAERGAEFLQRKTNH